MTVHPKTRFPNETTEYREARERLLEAEIELRRATEHLAAARRADYHAETPEGDEMPMLNVFAREGDAVRHTWGSELLGVPPDEGQDPRHVDTIWPLWNVLDLTPAGRGTDWQPRLIYD